MPTELSDLDRPRDLPRGTLTISREARLFATGGALTDRLRSQRLKTRLFPDEILHPEPPCDLVITVAPERDPADMYRVGFARGMGLPVILLVTPGSEPHPVFDSGIVVELGDGLEERLVHQLALCLG